MMDSSVEHDKRKFTRIDFAAQARLVNAAGEFISAHMIDISFKGALVKLADEAQPLQLDAHYTLEFILPGSHVVIRMRTQAIHQHQQQYGLRCESIDLDSVTHLRRLVELNLGSTQLLERELQHLSVH